MAAQDDILDEVESKANDTDDDDIMLDAKEHLTEDGKHNFYCINCQHILSTVESLIESGIYLEFGI